MRPITADNVEREGFGAVRSGWRFFKKNKQMLVGGVIVLIFIVTGITVYITSLVNFNVTPYDPIKQNTGPPLASPSLAHPFGTDLVGRDVFSRVIAATPGDIGIGFTVVAFSFAVGIMIGSFAAFRGGLLDEALMRITDIFFALPVLILAMAIGVALGPGIINMTFALMIIWWPAYARLARGEALKVATQNYIEASKLSGFGTARIILKHVLPNISIIMLVYATLDIGIVILVYSGLGYVGLTASPPAPDWGQMVNSYQDYMISAPWLPLFPGAIIALGVVAFSIFGDGLRDALQVS